MAQLVEHLPGMQETPGLIYDGKYGNLDSAGYGGGGGSEFKVSLDYMETLRPALVT